MELELEQIDRLIRKAEEMRRRKMELISSASSTPAPLTPGGAALTPGADNYTTSQQQKSPSANHRSHERLSTNHVSPEMSRDPLHESHDLEWALITGPSPAVSDRSPVSSSVTPASAVNTTDMSSSGVDSSVEREGGTSGADSSMDRDEGAHTPTPENALSLVSSKACQYCVVDNLLLLAYRLNDVVLSGFFLCLCIVLLYMLTYRSENIQENSSLSLSAQTLVGWSLRHPLSNFFQRVPP